MKILLIGRDGQLGWELNRTLQPLGEVIAVDQPELDLVDPGAIVRTVQSLKPGLIVNAAAYTNVDKAESQPELARSINALAPGILAEQASLLGAGLVHYSTDYVFDGTKGAAYLETDAPNPINVYGATKYEGERAIQQVGGAYIIFRTSWLYSWRRPGFLTRVLELARKQEVVQIVDDQIGSPTWALLLAEATAQVIAQGREDPRGYLEERSGLYHLAGAGAASRLEWVRAILELDPGREEQVMKELLPAASGDFPNPAKRPRFSALENSKLKLLNLQLPDWRRTLELSADLQKKHHGDWHRWDSQVVSMG